MSMYMVTETRTQSILTCGLPPCDNGELRCSTVRCFLAAPSTCGCLLSVPRNRINTSLSSGGAETTPQLSHEQATFSSADWRYSTLPTSPSHIYRSRNVYFDLPASFARKLRHGGGSKLKVGLRN
ncbi:hypothetical protein J6590_091622 [Homalodisca vitripennis]|nr:hypothetical protein J6590_091622 [Homalodisca vitripennis]